MKVLLMVGVLLLAGVARADGVMNNSGLIVPQGATITSVQFDGNADIGGVYYVDFTFDGGYGTAQGSEYEGEDGNLYFNTPVSDVSFTWEGEWFGTTDSAGDSMYSAPGFNGYDGGSSGTWLLAGDGITHINYWGSNWGGIDTFSYTPDAVPAPEPAGLLAIGLLGLLAAGTLTGCRRSRAGSPWGLST